MPDQFGLRDPSVKRHKTDELTFRTAVVMSSSGHLWWIAWGQLSDGAWDVRRHKGIVCDEQIIVSTVSERDDTIERFKAACELAAVLALL